MTLVHYYDIVVEKDKVVSCRHSCKTLETRFHMSDIVFLAAGGGEFSDGELVESWTC